MTRAVAAVIAVIAVAALAAGAIWLVRPKEDSGERVVKWEAKAREAFQPLVSAVPELVRGAREWQEGQRPADVFGDQVHKAAADFVRTRQRMAALKPSPEAPVAGELYENSAQLYVEVGRLYEVFLTTEPGEARTQLDLLVRRVRELADRVYDRGHAALAPYLEEAEHPDIEIRLPEEVPIWRAEGLAAGPPLDDPPGPTAESPPLRQASRPEGSRAAWVADVKAAGIPARRELDEGVAAGDAARLRDLARRFQAAADQLRDKPDPKGERDRSAVLRLGVLVDGEAARAAQAAAVFDGGLSGGLAEVSRALAGVGNDLVESSKPR